MSEISTILGNMAADNMRDHERAQELKERARIRAEIEAQKLRFGWIRIDPPNMLVCERCGEIDEMPVPMPLGDAAAMMANFDKDHSKCQK